MSGAPPAAAAAAAAAVAPSAAVAAMGAASPNLGLPGRRSPAGGRKATAAATALAAKRRAAAVAAAAEAGTITPARAAAATTRRDVRGGSMTKIGQVPVAAAVATAAAETVAAAAAETVETAQAAASADAATSVVAGDCPAAAAASGATSMERLDLRRAAEATATGRTRAIGGGNAHRRGSSGGDASRDGAGSRAPDSPKTSLIKRTVSASVEASRIARRAMMREDISKEVDKAVHKMHDPSGPPLKSVKKVVEQVHTDYASRAALPDRPWSEKDKKVIRPDVESVFDSSFVRPVAAVAYAAMIMRLYASEEPRGDVLTPFFPSAKNAVGNRSFTVKQFSQLLEIVYRRAILLLKARPTPPDIIKGLNMSEAGKNKVTLIILAVLRVILNDGRCQAREFWWRTIGYFIFHPSPLVYINVVDDTAARPQLESAEDSLSFAFKRATVASPSGSISVKQSVPRSIELMTNDALAKSSSRASTSAAAASSPPRATPTAGASATTANAGSAAAAPCHAPGEVQVQSTGCLFRVSSALLHTLSGRDPYKFPAPAVFAVALCLRTMVVEPRAHWTTDRGLAELGQDERNLPGRWYVLMPTMMKRAVEDKLSQIVEGGDHDPAGDAATAALDEAMEQLEAERDELLEEDDNLLHDIPMHLPGEEGGVGGNEAVA